jgi:hypothetical protein
MPSRLSRDACTSNHRGQINSDLGGEILFARGALLEMEIQPGPHNVAIGIGSPVIVSSKIIKRVEILVCELVI